MSTQENPTMDAQKAYDVLTETVQSADTITEDGARNAFRSAGFLCRLIADALERANRDFEDFFPECETKDEELLRDYGAPRSIGWALHWGLCAYEEIRDRAEYLERVANIGEEELRAEWKANLLSELKRGCAA